MTEPRREQLCATWHFTVEQGKINLKIIYICDRDVGDDDDDDDGVVVIMIEIIIVIITTTTTFMQGIYNYTPETRNVSTVCNAAAALYLQFVLHVMLFRPCTFASAFPAVCVQCPIQLFFVVP